MESTTDVTSYIMEKTKKMKEKSDDILELVYNQLVSEELGGTTQSDNADSSPQPTPVADGPSPTMTAEASPATVEPEPQNQMVTPQPAPAQETPVEQVSQPSPEAVVSQGPSAEIRTSTTYGEVDPWEGRKKTQLIVEFILTYLLAKKYGKPVPIITASIEDTINLQKVMLAIENDVNHILQVIEENWENFKDVQIEVNWENNSITIKPKE